MSIVQMTVSEYLQSGSVHVKIVLSIVLSVILVVVAVAISVESVDSADAADIFVLKHTESGYRIDRVQLQAGESKTFDKNESPEIIDVIFPAGPGGSGNLSQRGLVRSMTVRFDGESIELEAELADGKLQKMPSQSLSDLHNYDTHVSVTGADGSSASFVVLGYSRVEEDRIGLVMDMFGGEIPMQVGDYSIFLNTEVNTRRHKLTGEAVLEYSGKYLFAEVEYPDGRTGTHAVDIGASTSIITKKALPENVETSEVFAMEYSSGGVKKLKYSPGGGTGPVESILGVATLDSLTVGKLAFGQVKMDVIESLPELHGRDVDGIIGLDIMKTARYLTLDYGRDTGENARLILSDEPPAMTDVIEMPFTSIRKLMYVKGTIDSQPVFFIVDSGSPDCLLQPRILSAVESVTLSDSGYTYQGGGGQKEEGKFALIETLSLGGVEMSDIPCTVGKLSVLSGLGKGQFGGLIGNSLLSRYASITVDFHERTIGLAR